MRKSLPGLAVIAALWGCGDATLARYVPESCIPGEIIPCNCETEQAGLMRCEIGGRGFGECVCQPVEHGAEPDADSDGEEAPERDVREVVEVDSAEGDNPDSAEETDGYEEAERDTEPDADNDCNADADTDTDTDADTDAGTAEVEPEVSEETRELETEPDADAEQDPDVEQDACCDASEENRLENEVEPDADAGTDTDTDAGTDAGMVELEDEEPDADAEEEESAPPEEEASCPYPWTGGDCTERAVLDCVLLPQYFVCSDYVAGLMWEGSYGSAGKPWEQAVTDCDRAQTGAYWDDWRLPSVDELRTLMVGCPGTEPGGSCGVTDDCTDLGCADESCDECERCEGHCEDGCYSLGWAVPQNPPLGLLRACDWHWSSDEVADSSELAWLVNFVTGAVETKGKVFSVAARCVRDLP